MVFQGIGLKGYLVLSLISGFRKGAGPTEPSLWQNSRWQSSSRSILLLPQTPEASSSHKNYIKNKLEKVNDRNTNIIL